MQLISEEITYQLIGKCMTVHRILGHGFLEIVYKDAIEFELANSDIDYQREKEYCIKYKGILLPHRFYADFIINNTVILEIKSAEGEICNSSIAQTINYLKVSECRIGLIVNFGKSSMEYKRLVL